MTATCSFSLEKSLGIGSFVYHGKMNDGQEMAVKRFVNREDFKNEIIIVSKLQHRNVVKLLRYCIDGDEGMLVYEFMPNKSLDQFLFDPLEKTMLGWKKCWEIIEGVAQGMEHLHHKSKLKIIHRNLKPKSILLDENMDPKITGFYLAKICSGDGEETTDSIAGTIGYIAPEYLMEGKFSDKVDVFSFGILVLEVVSGSRQHPLEDVWELWKGGKAMEIVDPRLKDSAIDEN